MKKELNFITIDGKYYGGDQNWHPTHKMMRLGGCSAVCACEVCMYLAKTFPDKRGLYPYDPGNISMKDFLAFFETMFQYIYPGIGGLTSIDKFARMLRRYAQGETDVKLNFEQLPGNEPYEKAEQFVRNAIDADLPLMYLLLGHRDRALDEYEWHWFTVTGYEDGEDGFSILFATWGKQHKLGFRRLWETGKHWRGGMVLAR